MLVDLSQDVLAPIERIMDRRGASCSPEEFHAAVNVTFHNFEAEVYDQEHSDMWESLPREFDRLANDCAQAVERHHELSLLDIGCGTGLATDCLLKSRLAAKIKTIELLDSSRSMLKKAEKPAAGWKRPVTFNEGSIDDLPKGKKYSLIVTCSVLHHIPNLEAFLGAVRSLQADGGMYIHLQDPNGDYLSDPELLQRLAQMKNKRLLQELIRRFSPVRALSRIYRGLIQKQDFTYCVKTNQELLNRGLIATPLSIAEIYCITDIHVSDGTGISVERMKRWMPDYELISARSYAFWGTLWSKLPPRMKRLEEELAKNKALNGMHIGAAWKLR
jgi:2-polyprenyl-3-methyl-5-hydroxy-6-metoxy-1,4-benzoquinol methylase